MGVNVTSKMVKEKALELAAHLNISEDFQASDGWLRRFKIRFVLPSY
jgi:hypothetical protein